MARPSAGTPRVSRASATAAASAKGPEMVDADTSLIAGRTPRSVKKSLKALEMDEALPPRRRLSHASPATAAAASSTAAPEPSPAAPSSSTARRTSRRSAVNSATRAGAAEASDAEMDAPTAPAVSPKRKSARVSYPPAAEALTLAERRAELAKLPAAATRRASSSPLTPTPEPPKRSTRGLRTAACSRLPSNVSSSDEDRASRSTQLSEDDVEEATVSQPLATPRVSRRRATDTAQTSNASARVTRRESAEATPQAASRGARAVHARSASVQDAVVPDANGDAGTHDSSPAKVLKAAWQKKTFLTTGLYASSASADSAPRAARASMPGGKAAASTTARGRGRVSLPAPAGTARTRGKQGASAFPAPVHYGETLLAGPRDFRLPFPIAEQEEALRSKLAAKRKPPPYGLISVNRWVSRKRIHGEIPVCQCEPSDICGDECMNRMMQYVCSEKTCPCGERCTNVSLGRRPGAKTDVAYYGKRGFGLRAAQDIPAKSFIGEYRGEVIDTAECGRRVTQYYKDTGNFYFLDYDAAAGEVLDGGLRGNSARFANHSCDPNCYIEKWLISGSDEERDAEFQIGLFALRDIRAGDELTYDYGWSAFAARKAVAGGLAVSSMTGNLSGGLGRSLGGMMPNQAGPSRLAGASAGTDALAPTVASADMTMSERCLCGADNCAGILGGKKAPPTAAASRQLIACATAAQAGAKVKAAKAARANSSRSSQADSNAPSVPNTPSRSNTSARSSVAVEPLTSSQREREASFTRASEARTARSLARSSPALSLTPPRATRVPWRAGAASRRLAPMELDSDGGTNTPRSSGNGEDLPTPPPAPPSLLAPIAPQQQEQQQQPDGDVQMSSDRAADSAVSPAVAAPAAGVLAAASAARSLAQAASPTPEADDAAPVRTTRLGRSVKAPTRWAPSLAPTFTRKRKTPPPSDKDAAPAPPKLPRGVPWKFRPVERRPARTSAAPDAQAAADPAASASAAGNATTTKSLGKRKRASQAEVVDAGGSTTHAASGVGEGAHINGESSLEGTNGVANGEKRARLDASSDAVPAKPVKAKKPRGPKKKRGPGRPRTKKRPFFDFSKFPAGTEFVTSNGKPYDFNREHKVGRKPKIYTREQHQRRIVEKRERNAFLARMRRRQADTGADGNGEAADDASDRSDSDDSSVASSDDEQMSAAGGASGSGPRANRSTADASSPARGSRARSLTKSANGSAVPALGAALSKAERANLEMTTDDYRCAAIGRVLYLKSAWQALTDAGMDAAEIRKAKNGFLARVRRLKQRGYGEEAAARLAYKTQKEDRAETPLARAHAILEPARDEYKLAHSKENARQRRERYKVKKRSQAAAARSEAGSSGDNPAAGSSASASATAPVVAPPTAGGSRIASGEPSQPQAASAGRSKSASGSAAPRAAVHVPSPALSSSIAPPAPPAPLSDKPPRAGISAVPPSPAAANGQRAATTGDDRAQLQASGSALAPGNMFDERRSLAAELRS